MEYYEIDSWPLVTLTFRFKHKVCVIGLRYDYVHVVYTLSINLSIVYQSGRKKDFLRPWIIINTFSFLVLW